MPGTPIAGTNGTVKIGSTDVATVLKWTLEKSRVSTAYGSNETSGGTKRLLGRADATGTIEGYLDSAAAMTITEGTSATLKLYINASKFYSIPAVIEKFQVTTDANSTEPVGYVATFGLDGTITEISFA